MFSKIKEYSKIREFKLAFIVGVVTVFLYFLSGSASETDENGRINRGDYGDNPKNVTVVAKTEEGTGKEIEITVQSRRYTEDECEDLFVEHYQEICNRLLGDNNSLDEVTKDLFFFSTFEGLPFEFEWTVSNRDIFDEDGKLIAHEGGSLTLYLTVSYEEWMVNRNFKVNYSAAESFTDERVMEDLIKAVKETEEETRSEEFLDLPPEIDGQRITYTDYNSGRNPAIFLLGLAAIIAIVYGARNDKLKEEAKRKEAIIEEYSTVLQKMVMYLSAGMNIRNVWIRIYEDSVAAGSHNPIYQEMGITVNELKNGVSEFAAYKGFSKRTGIPEITRFTTLLSQNLKKGSTDILKLLSVEANDAFEKRKRRARIKGEEAGTKLLVPLGLLMIVIMVIIILPAFWSM